MTTVFVGGSRHVSRLPEQVRERLSTIVQKRHHVVVGDANGADKAVQKYLFEAFYPDVTVFCSGATPRNNVGAWRIESVFPPKGTKGFQFYAAKDREMARVADVGLMVWDGKSPGTLLNVLRLLRAGKIAVLFETGQSVVRNIKSGEHWSAFLAELSSDLIADLRARATDAEWDEAESGLFSASGKEMVAEHPQDDSDAAFTIAINAALATGDPRHVVDTLGTIARERGMTHVAREAGLARESLYRSLGAGGNPEFSTVLRVLSSLGLRLQAQPSASER